MDQPSPPSTSSAASAITAGATEAAPGSGGERVAPGGNVDATRLGDTVSDTVGDTVSGSGSLWSVLRNLPGVRSWTFLSDGLFLCLSFFIGLVWFAVFVVMGALGLALAVVLVGLLILAATPLLARFGARLERERIRVFLGETIIAPERRVDPKAGLIRRAIGRMRDRAIWREFTYLLLLFPLGIAELMIAFWALLTPIIMVTSPLTFWIGDGPEPLFAWNIDHFGEAIIAALLAGVVAVPAAKLLNLTARGHLVFARWLLGPGSEEELVERVEELTESRSAVMRAAHLERRRIERDLHDGAQQRLVALAMDLGLAREKLERDLDGARELIERSHEESKRVLAELRELVRGIHPAVLSDRGLDAAISAVAGRSPVPVKVDVDLPGRLPEEMEGTAYFVVVEALTNITKHSGATEAQVNIRRDGPWLRIEITDNGKGGADPEGTGLKGLRDRIAALDGRMHLFSPPGGGTTLAVDFPCA